MHSAKRAKTLTNYLSSRLTSEQEQRITEHADKAGLTKSEWCRQAILRSLDVPPDAKLVLAELMSLRRIVLGLFVDSIQGQKLTEDRLRSLVEQAEAAKQVMADNRIQAFISMTNAVADQAPESAA